MLPTRAKGETFVSATICLQQCVLVCQGLELKVMVILRTALISHPFHSAQYLVSLKRKLLQSFQTAQATSYFEFFRGGGGADGDTISLISSQTV